MHPLLSTRGQLAALGVAWLQISGLLVALLALGGALSFREAVALAVPLSGLYAADGIALYYLARALPLRTTSPGKLALTFLLGAFATASLWTALGRGWVEVLFRLELPAPSVPGAVPFGPEPAVSYARAAPIVFGVGLLLFLLALAIHYLALEAEESRAARTRALELQLHSRDAELKALRAQLQPHFLYNALNSISALIRADPAAARRTTEQLGELLRRSLALGSRERISVGEELELCEALLGIERVRFGERLDYRLDVSEDARLQPLPPLLLQPLVENAVTHGIAGLLDGGTIRIGARVEGDRLELSIDNPREPEGRTPRGTGIGLENVRRRLLALYGREAALRVQMESARFRVEVSLPAEGETGASVI